MNIRLKKANKKCVNIKSSKINIYQTIDIGDPKLWFTSLELSELLNNKLKGKSLFNLPLRTRSKKAKEIVCLALGYPIPKKFEKIRPRFTGQQFDLYVQKANNLQIWNEQLDPQRRYVIMRIDDKDIITSVKVVTGFDLSKLDTTGTLTQKYQAHLTIGKNPSELLSRTDTDVIKSLLGNKSTIDLSNQTPDSDPVKNYLLNINTIFEKLEKLVGKQFKDTGKDQERNRGIELQKLVCKKLGYKIYKDNGQFPDIRNQLLEIKLQTSPTIDLGLISPDSEKILDIEKLDGYNIRHCDVRYAIFYAEILEDKVKLTHFYLTSGKDFFSKFTKFGGKILNKKIQISLPSNFFNK